MVRLEVGPEGPEVGEKEEEEEEEEEVGEKKEEEDALCHSWADPSSSLLAFLTSPHTSHQSSLAPPRPQLKIV